jgi:hypothetical protein
MTISVTQLLIPAQMISWPIRQSKVSVYWLFEIVFDAVHAANFEAIRRTFLDSYFGTKQRSIFASILQAVSNAVSLFEAAFLYSPIT